MCKTIHHKVVLKLPPETVYEMLADSKKHSALTKQKALIGKKIGQSFSTHSKKISGIVVDLAKDKRIIQAWRRTDFPHGIFSMASLFLSPTPQGGTQLRLVHRGVPKELIPSVEEHWRSEYWTRLKSSRL